MYVHSSLHTYSHTPVYNIMYIFVFDISVILLSLHFAFNAYRHLCMCVLAHILYLHACVYHLFYGQ